MSAADEAFEKARDKIAEAKAEGLLGLSFGSEDFRALEVIPEEIAELQALRHLDLDNTQVSDLSPLAALTGLQDLYLTQTGVTDLSPLAALTGLQQLYLTQTGVTDLSPLAALTGLRELSLNQTGVTDLSPLAALTGLQQLWLTQTGVTDLSPLAALTGLQQLWLTQTGVTDLSPLAALTGLQRLDLDQTGVMDLSPLAALTGLRELWLTQTGVTDLSPLAALTGLQGLWLTQTGVTDLSPLRGLTGLYQLYLNSTQVLSLQDLSGLTELDELQVSGTQISDLSPLAELEILDGLHFVGCPVADLRPLIGLEKLASAPSSLGGLRFENCAACEIDSEIAAISRIADNKDRAARLFDYLKDWVPPFAVENLPDQSPDGFSFSLDVQGRLTLSLARNAQDRQIAQLHAILTEEVAELLEICPAGPNQGYGRVSRMLGRYQTALGDEVAGIVPAVLWNAGNKLRIELASDVQRSGTAMDDQPKLPGDLRDGLEGLVTAHNAFASGHADLAALDAVRLDAIDRHRADLDRDRMEAFLTALEGQTRMIVAEALNELRALHEQTTGDAAASLRALEVEQASLENLINCAVREALIQERGGTLSEISGDSRAAAVGVVAAGVAEKAAPVVAATLPQLITVLQPHMAGFLAATHGAGYPLSDAIDYVVWSLRKRVARPEAFNWWPG